MNEYEDMWVWAPWFNGPRLVEATDVAVSKFADDNPDHLLFYAKLVSV